MREGVDEVAGVEQGRELLCSVVGICCSDAFSLICI